MKYIDLLGIYCSLMDKPNTYIVLCLSIYNFNNKTLCGHSIKKKILGIRPSV